MSADYRTEHFKGYRHKGYVHVERVYRDDFSGATGEVCVGDFTKDEVAELASMFEQEELAE